MPLPGRRFAFYPRECVRVPLDSLRDSAYTSLLNQGLD